MSEFAFGLSIPPSVLPGTDPVASARMAEDLGFDFVSASPSPDPTSASRPNDSLATWSRQSGSPQPLEVLVFRKARQ